MILRVGDCTVGVSPDTVTRAIAVFDSLDIQVVVLRSPTDLSGGDRETLTEEILVLGRLFGQEREAAALAEELTAVGQMVATRVSGIPEREQVRALCLGPASSSASSARAPPTGPGSRVPLNAEQILALDLR